MRQKPLKKSKYSLIKRYAFYLMKFFRVSFDFVTNYGENKMNAKKWMFRFCFLETLAGVN